MIFWNGNYIEYESNGDRNKTLLVEEYFLKNRPYLKGHHKQSQKFDT